jgi:hypothetical protein
VEWSLPSRPLTWTVAPWDCPVHCPAKWECFPLRAVLCGGSLNYLEPQAPLTHPHACIARIPHLPATSPPPTTSPPTPWGVFLCGKNLTGAYPCAWIQWSCRSCSGVLVVILISFRTLSGGLLAASMLRWCVRKGYVVYYDSSCVLICWTHQQTDVLHFVLISFIWEKQILLASSCWNWKAIVNNFLWSRSRYGSTSSNKGHGNVPCSKFDHTGLSRTGAPLIVRCSVCSHLIYTYYVLIDSAYLGEADIIGIILLKLESHCQQFSLISFKVW